MYSSPTLEHLYNYVHLHHRIAANQKIIADSFIQSRWHLPKTQKASRICISPRTKWRFWSFASVFQKFDWAVFNHIQHPLHRIEKRCNLVSISSWVLFRCKEACFFTSSFSTFHSFVLLCLQHVGFCLFRFCIVANLLAPALIWDFFENWVSTLNQTCILKHWR